MTSLTASSVNLAFGPCIFDIVQFLDKPSMSDIISYVLQVIFTLLVTSYDSSRVTYSC